MIPKYYLFSPAKFRSRVAGYSQVGANFRFEANFTAILEKFCQTKQGISCFQLEFCLVIRCGNGSEIFKIALLINLLELRSYQHIGRRVLSHIDLKDSFCSYYRHPVQRPSWLWVHDTMLCALLHSDIYSPIYYLIQNYRRKNIFEAHRHIFQKVM